VLKRLKQVLCRLANYTSLVKPIVRKYALHTPITQFKVEICVEFNTD